MATDIHGHHLAGAPYRSSHIQAVRGTLEKRTGRADSNEGLLIICKVVPRRVRPRRGSQRVQGIIAVEIAAPAPIEMVGPVIVVAVTDEGVSAGPLP